MARMTVKTSPLLLESHPQQSRTPTPPRPAIAELRERILTAAEELGYPGPDAGGRSSKNGPG